MTHNTSTSVVIADGHWMHIRYTQIHHRNYPEVRGEGCTLSEAICHLTDQLTRCLESAHGPERETVKRALDDIRKIRSLPRTRQGSGTLVAIS